MPTTITAYSDTTPPAHPTLMATDRINAVRERFGIFPTAFSDVFATQVDDSTSADAGDTLGQRALKIIGRSYRSNSKSFWSSQIKKEQSSTIPTWRDIPTTGSEDMRVKFAKAYDLIDACSYGMWGNSEYSTHATHSGTTGGDDNFPIYPADMRYIANGPAQEGNNPGAGYNQAIADIREGLRDSSIYADYLNAVSLTLYDSGVIVNGKRVSGEFYYDAVFKSFMSEEYYRYMHHINDGFSDDIKQAASYFFNLELNTLIFFSKKTATEISIERCSADLAERLKSAFSGNANYAPEVYFDTSVAPYMLKRIKLAIASSTNGLVKSSASALQLLIDMLTTDKTQVAGITQNREIQNLMIVLSGGAYLGASPTITLKPELIDEAVENAISGSRLTFSDITAKNKFVDALKTLNTSGLLGTVGCLITLTRAVYDSLNLEPTMESGKVKANRILGLVSRYMGVYGGLGNALQFIRFMSSPTKTVFLVAARALRFDRISSAVWGSTGTIETEISMTPSVSTRALENVSTLMSNNFAESSFTDETNVINEMFEQEVITPARSMQSVGTHSVESIVDDATAEIASQIESISSETISSASAMSAVKAFGASTALVGFVGEILMLASGIVNVAIAPKPGAGDFVYLSSSILGVSGSAIGMGIAYGFLESAAFPPLAIGLGISSIVLALGAAIDELVTEKRKVKEVRRKMTDALQSFQANGYLHEWGEKIQFLSVYFDSTRDPKDHAYNVTRWSPPELSIFEDEAEAWRAFQLASGSFQQRFQTASSKLIHAKLTPR